MTAPFRLSKMAPSDPARSDDGASRVKNPSRNLVDAAASRRWFADLLWRAFPSRSEAELAETAAVVLEVSSKQVRNWLRCEHSAAWPYVARVMAIAGAEIVFRRIEGQGPHKDGGRS